MSGKSLVQRWSTWLVMWAVMLHALAPGMAHAMLAGSELPHEVCSSTGIVRLAEPVPDDAGQSGSTTSGAHCQWCLLDLAADLPAADRLRPMQRAVSDTLAALPEAPLVAAPWRLAQPRAPPSFV